MLFLRSSGGGNEAVLVEANRYRQCLESLFPLDRLDAKWELKAVEIEVFRQEF